MNPIRRIAYAGGLHTFWIDAEQRLCQKLDHPNGVTNTYNISAECDFDKLRVEPPELAIAPDGDLLVGVFGEKDGVFNEARWDTAVGKWRPQNLS